MFLEVEGVRRRFKHGGGEIEILKGIGFQAQPGEFISIMGPSGSGKSTLLQIIGGLDRASDGSIRIDGTAINQLNDAELSRFRRRRLGFVFQFFNLIPTLSALENVALPLMLDGQSASKVKERATHLLEKMKLGHRIRNRPAQLSGGEMQRVAIARALVTDPALILADEATGNLDSKTGVEVLELLQKLVQEEGKTLILVTHDPKAASYGNRVIRLRDGMMESDGPA